MWKLHNLETPEQTIITKVEALVIGNRILKSSEKIKIRPDIGPLECLAKEYGAQTIQKFLEAFEQRHDNN